MEGEVITSESATDKDAVGEMLGRWRLPGARWHGAVFAGLGSRALPKEECLVQPIGPNPPGHEKSGRYRYESPKVGDLRDDVRMASFQHQSSISHLFRRMKCVQPCIF